MRINKMDISIYRLKYNVSNYINLKYDSITIPLLTREEFNIQYEYMGTFNIHFNVRSCIDTLNQLKEKYNIFLNIGDIIKYDNETYYFDINIVKFNLF